MPRKLLLFSVILLMGTADRASAKLSTWKVGGESCPWARSGEIMRAIDDISCPGAIQAKEFHPGENITQAILLPGEKWYARIKPVNPEFKPGMPHAWTTGVWGTVDTGPRLVDGDPNLGDTSMLVPQASGLRSMYTIDFGVPVPVNKVVFYPRQEGQDIFYNRPCKENYMKGYSLSASLEWPECLKEEERGHAVKCDLPILLRRNDENLKSIVEVEVPMQYLRVFRLRPTVDLPSEVAEIEVYGEGFASKAVYTSKIIDLGVDANFGEIGWAASKWRRIEKGPLEQVPDTQPVVTVETRSGKDTTPLLYYEYTEKHKLRVVDEQTWRKLKIRSPGYPIVPHMQGPVTYDEENWSHWSLPYSALGEQIKSPGPRRYFQFRITLQTEDFRETTRIDSLWFELSSPPLAEEILGEVALLGEPDPPEGASTVIAGRPATFTYDLKANFTSPLQAGLDSLQINLPSKAEFDSLQVGNKDTLITVACKDSIFGPSVYKDLVTGERIWVDTSSPEKIVAYFPSQPIAYGSRDRLRLVFSTSVLVYGTRFTGKVWKSGADDLPQSIQPGDANTQVTTNKLRVLVQEESVGTVLNAVEVVPKAITPNGDGVNDQAVISYTLLQIIGQAKVEIGIYDLSGAKVKTVYKGSQTKGIYKDESGTYCYRVWKGDGDKGEPVPPGLYIWRISVDSDRGLSDRLGTIAVVY